MIPVFIFLDVGEFHRQRLKSSLDEVEWNNLLFPLEKQNVEIVAGRVELWGVHGTGISIYVQYPEGNLIEER